MSTNGLLAATDLRHCTIFPGMAPTYVRLDNNGVILDVTQQQQ